MVKGNLFSADLAEDFYAISVDASWALDNHTANEGPLHVGFAHGDLTEAEIVECLTSEVIDPGDLIQVERSRRPVRRTGSLPADLVTGPAFDGRIVRTRLKFKVNDGNQVVAFCHSRDSGPLTTGTLVKLDGTLYGRWMI